jgi:hypothetical protein
MGFARIQAAARTHLTEKAPHDRLEATFRQAGQQTLSPHGAPPDWL